MNTVNNQQSEHTELHSFFARLETDRSLNNEQSKPSFGHRVLKSMFTTVDRFAPAPARSWGMKLFFTPIQRKLRDKDYELLQEARVESIGFNNELLPVLTWGEASNPAIIMVHGWGGRPTDFGAWVKPLIEKGFRVVSAEGPAHGDSKARQTSLPELSEFFKKLVENQNNIAGYVGHSLGGSVILLGFKMGVEPRPSIFINTPADPDGIMDVFLKKIEAGEHVGEYIKEEVDRQFGQKFDEFSALHTAKYLPEVPILIIHDRFDTESPIYHFEAFKEVIPWSEHMVTENLGHNRILLEDEVVERATMFINENKNGL